MRPPNLLVLMPDQMRADCLSCAGHPDVRTPNLDRLASEGVRFTNALSTNPVCMPARASFLTGRHSSEHGIWRNEGRLPRKSRTFLRPLREAGYRTAHVGKSHYYPHDDARHLERRRHRSYLRALGLDEVHEVTGPKAAAWCGSILTDHWEQLGLLRLFREDYARRRAVGPFEATWPSPLPEGETLDDFIAARALELLERLPRERPFFLFVGFGGPHDPWDPPRSWSARYDPARVAPPRPPGPPGAHATALAAAFHRHVQGAFTPEPGQIARIRASYYAKVSHIDHLVGDLLAALEARGLLEETAVLFWSDHGEMLGDRGRLGKAVLLGPALRVPLLLRLPGARGAGTVVEAPVSVADAPRTLLELAGVPADMPGRSLLGALRGAHDAVRPVFAELAGDNGLGAAGGGRSFERQELVCDGRFSLARSGDGEVLLLHDLRDDPFEDRNRAGDPALREETARLCGLLDAWRARLEGSA